MVGANMRSVTPAGAKVLHDIGQSAKDADGWVPIVYDSRTITLIVGALVRRGLVETTFHGGGYIARLTADGQRWLDEREARTE
jgi:hypothetical protein